MNAARWLESRGVRIWAEGDALTLEGLSSLTPENASEVLAFARKNKARVLEELEKLRGLPTCLCLGCGKAFTPYSENTVYCHVRCFNTMRGTLQ